MKPHIGGTSFGSITIEGITYDHDLVIRADGKIKKRKKKLSKKIHGTGHLLSIDEIRYVLKNGGEQIIVGAGQEGELDLSKETKQYLDEKGIKYEVLPTPGAIVRWNECEGLAAGLFHVTC
jgi:hypothetical protein